MEKIEQNNVGDLSKNLNPEEEIVKKEIILTPEQEEKKEEMTSYLKEGRSFDAIKLLSEICNSGISENDVKKIILAPEVQQAAIEGMIICLNKAGYTDGAFDIIDKFCVPAEILSSPKAQEAAKNGLINCLNWRDNECAYKILDKFSISKEVILSPKVQEAAKEAIEWHINGRDFDDVFELKNRFFVSEKDFYEIAKKEIVRWLDTDTGTYNEIRVRDGIYFAPLVAKNLSIPQEIVQQAVEEVIYRKLTYTEYDFSRESDFKYIATIVEQFSVPEDFVKRAEIKALAEWLEKSDDFDSISKFVEKLPISEDIIRSEEVKWHCRQSKFFGLFQRKLFFS